MLCIGGCCRSAFQSTMKQISAGDGGEDDHQRPIGIWRIRPVSTNSPGVVLHPSAAARAEFVAARDSNRGRDNDRRCSTHSTPHHKRFASSVRGVAGMAGTLCDELPPTAARFDFNTYSGARIRRFGGLGATSGARSSRRRVTRAAELLRGLSNYRMPSRCDPDRMMLRILQGSTLIPPAGEARNASDGKGRKGRGGV